MEFELPKNSPSIIKVIGVGGGGGNAVNHMYRQGIRGVDFIICNTDHQVLEASPVQHKIQLGASLTEGNGAGSIPEVGKNAAIETIDEVKEYIEKNTKMVFITAGMGGGTGTGAAPVIAEACKEMGILTVGIVTMPFFFEGRKRKSQAEEGIKAIRENVDTLLIINNDKLREMYGNLKMREAFAQADSVLSTAAKGIAEIITRTGHVNVDFEDVRTVMAKSGVAIMGSAAAGGENRSIAAVENALASPLLNDNDIRGARYVLLNMEFGSEEHEISMDEIAEITDYIQDEAGATADIIWGYGADESLGEELRVTVIATGFNKKEEIGENTAAQPKRKVHTLDEEPENKPLDEPKSKKQTDEAAQEEEDSPYLKSNRSESSGTIEFDLENDRTQPYEQPRKTDDFEPFLKNQEEKPDTPGKPRFAKADENKNDDEKKISTEEQQKRARARIKKISEWTSRMRKPNGITEMENEPAYKRRSIKLDEVPHSSESQVSRFSLKKDENDDEGRGRLRDNNSFLHDNVD